MSKLPAFQFYPADWRKDPGIQSLSFHDRGVWFEILCLMHESEQRGKLLLNGKPMPEDALARLLGLDKQNLTKTLSTLIDYGVATRGEDGVLMNRRMVRDEEKRLIDKEYGKLGGNPALTKNYNRPGFLYAIQRSSDGWVKIGISEKPTRRLYKLRYQFKSESLEMLAFRHVEDMGKAESEAHSKYRHLPNNEDWFELKGTDLDSLVSTLKGKDKGKGEGKDKGNSKGKQTPSSSSSTSVSYESKDSTDKPPDVIWGLGVQMLVRSGMEQEKARSFLGGLAKQHGKTQLATAIAQTSAANPANPKEYLAKVVQGNKTNGVAAPSGMVY